ncbi:MAG: hypothetical protein ACXAC2_18835 [Candidatus Kariarchaeaceae archaeon]
MLLVSKKTLIIVVMPVLGISLLSLGILFGGNLNPSPEPELYVVNVDTPLLEIPMGNLTQTEVESLLVVHEALNKVILKLENQKYFIFKITQDEFDQILDEFDDLIGPSPTKSWYIFFEGNLLEASLGYLVIE